MVTCDSMVEAVLVKKPVMVGKVLSVTTSLEWDGIIGCRADLAGLERRSFLDRSTNNNTPKNGIFLRVRLIGNR